MRSAWRLAALPLLAALGACSCDDVAVQKAQGSFSVSPKVLDFGIACLDETTERQLVIENTGNIPVTLKELKITGAEFALLEPAPEVIEVGEQLVVRVGFTPTIPDRFSRTLTVTTDTENEPTQTVTIIGEGFEGKRQDFRVECEATPGSGTFGPCFSLPFDDVLAGTSKDATARLKNLGCANVDVNELQFIPDVDGLGTEADTKFFSLPNDTAPFSLRGGETKDVVVRFTAPQEAVVPAAKLRIATTDPEVKDNRWAPGEWQLGLFAVAVAPSLLVDPKTLTFFDTPPTTKSFTVRNQGNAPLTIDSIVVEGEDGTTDFSISAADTGPFTLQPTGGASASKTIAVTYAPASAGSDKGMVVITAGSEKAEVRLVAGAEPMLVVEWTDETNLKRTPPIDFGTIETGSKNLSRNVRLRNDGQADLNLTTVELTNNVGNGYTLVAPVPAPVAPGGFFDMSITLNDAIGLRDDSAKLRIVSNDPVDATNAGERLIDVLSSNQPNFKPVPVIDFCPRTPGSTQCQSSPRRDLDLVFNASRSTGPELTDTLSIRWSLPVQPTGGQIRVDDPNAEEMKLVRAVANVEFLPGNYVVKLTVTDQFGNSDYRSLPFTLP